MTSGVKKSPPTTLAWRLRDMREVARMTQADMAAVLCTGANRVSDYETGVREPGLAVLRRYARYFRVTLADLLRGVQ